MEALAYDLRLALRALSRRPALCALAGGSIAVGIAINVAVFTIFNSILLRPMGVPGADSLLLVGSPLLNFAQQDTLREAVAAQGEVFGFRMGGPVSLDHGPEDVPLAIVTPNYFSALGLGPALGAWPAGSVEATGEASLVLSHSLWRRRFAADPQVIGRKVRLGTLPARVVAVGPPGFRGLGPMASDAWQPASSGAANSRDASPGWNAMVRVRPGLSPRQARTFVESALLALPGVAGTGTGRTQVNATPLVEIQRLVWILITVFMAVPGLVLLVACANVSGLLAARAEERREEMAVRLAIGGGRGRLVRQLLAEGTVLAAGGAALGLLAARWMVDGISPWLLPALAGYGIYPELFLDARAIALAVGLAAAATLAASLLPALAASKADLTPLLKREVAGFGRGRRFRYPEALAIGQLVVTFAFVATAVLCARSFSRNLEAPLGFLPDRVLTMFVAFPGTAPGPARAQRIEDVLAGVRALPAVGRATLASSPPAVPTREVTLRPPGAGDPAGRAGFNAVRPEFFALAGARLQRGRLLEEADVRFDQPVAVVTAALAQRLWPESDPVGRAVTIGDAGVAATIVGVVADPAEVARVEHSAGKPAAPTIYVPLGRQLLGSSGGMSLVVESRGPLGTLGSDIARLVADRHPGAVVAGVRTIADVNRAGMIQSEIASVTYTLLGTLCGLLGAVGLYGSLAQLVLRRTHEFGIRRALGATAKDVFRLVLRRGSTLALVAIGLGVPTAFAVARIFGSAVPDLPALDLLTLAVGCGLVVALALAASFFPARRATLVDPMIALRHD